MPVYEQLFNLGPYPCLVTDDRGNILAINPPARERLDLPAGETPGHLQDLFSDTGFSLEQDLQRAVGTNDWLCCEATIGTGGLTGLRVQLSLRGLYLGRPDPTSHVLIWMRDDVASTMGLQTDLIRRLNREAAREREMREELAAALAREQHLHGELIHRVKNNLSILASLIRMRSDGQDDPQVRLTLQAIELRTRSIALVHDLLDRNTTTDVINAGDLITELCKLMSQSIVPEQVKLNCEVDSLTLHNEDATRLCLLINELVTNSLKHAFPDNRTGSITLAFRRNGVEKMELRIADDGKGLAPNRPDPARSDTRGTRIVHALAEQMRGELVQKTSGGMEWTLIFHPRVAHNDAPAA